MEDTKRTFTASSELFSDYSAKISLYHVTTIDDIIKTFKDDLIKDLQNLNLICLIEMVEKKNFHIHGYSIEDILTSNTEKVFFICDHE